MRSAWLVGIVLWAGLAEPVRCPAGELFRGEDAGTAVTRVDQLVFPRFEANGFKPALCPDEVFVRRIHLDVLGKLPTAEEARGFIQNTNRISKRQELIEQLLARPEFADYWAMKWGDLLRIKAEFPVNLWPNAAQAYHRWVRASLADNKPYDQFARELLTASGSNFRAGQVNFYRAIPDRTPEGIATAVALTFMGCRTETWPTNQLAGMAAFFAQVGYKPTREWKEEIVYWDAFRTSGATGAPGTSAPGILPDGTTRVLNGEKDPREIFADWLIRPENPWFTRNIANRAWSWLLGRGIIHEPDDIREGNPPVNPELLAYLEQELIRANYDLKHLFRLILNSKTYQLSPAAFPDQEQAEARFAAYPLRRLEAEVLIDAIHQITGATDLYTSAIPEPFTYIPQDVPAVAIADGSITSPFLALFGRPARASGMENERNNRMLPAQWLHLLNSSHIQRKIEQGPKLKALFEAKRRPSETLNELYLTVLSRFPTVEEVQVLDQLGKPGRGGRTKAREDWIDVTWALINSTEFLYRH